MKLRLVVKIAVIVSVVSLCTGFAVYSFLRLNAVENSREFNLYSLVPQDAVAVLETHKMAELVKDVNELTCSKNNHYLYVSELFVYLKNHLQTLVDDTPHGLSKQMNKMLISFHEPDNPMNQVLYCSLGSGDYELLEAFVGKYSSKSFPYKLFEYKGEDIRIYPMKNGTFLAVYITSDFLAVSFQKQLLERVIDARRKKKSLMQLPSFAAMHSGVRSNVATTIYIRMRDVDMGKHSDTICSQARVGSWAEFDMQFKEDAIYCSGISHGIDTTDTFINALRKQQAVEGFPGDWLPATTFFYNRWALSDRVSMLGFTARQEYAHRHYSDYVKQRDEEWLSFLNDYASESVMSCLFHSPDTTQHLPCAVLNIPMHDAVAAERYLRKLVYSTPKEEGFPQLPSLLKYYRLYPQAWGYKPYVLPRNTLLTQLTGITESALYTYAIFFRGHLLLAPDYVSLLAYIHTLQNNELLDGKFMYEEGISSLSPMYNYVMMGDMEALLTQPDSYVRLVPNFFFRHAKFFRHFMLGIQFTCTEGVVYPNIVLLYKENQ